MSNLITTKLSVPALPSVLIDRPNLLWRLKLAPSTKLVLVSAPAGAGKSTLLGQWLKQQKSPEAWVSLEPSENDLERFFHYLIAAVYHAEPQLGSRLLEGLSLGVQEASPVITLLLNKLTELETPLIIVLDDYHVITNAHVHAATELLLEHLPINVCLVLGTRTDPPFALSRLRVRGQMVEVRGDALRFSPKEIDALLNGQHGLGLSVEAIASLEERTEGWVAGLQLAALSLTDRHDKEAVVANLVGSHLHFAAYLFSEVFEDQPDELQLFLQRTAILDRLTVPLCQAVVGIPVGAKQLHALAAKNLFLIPLDDVGTWYRYHHLFAEFLRHRLGEAEPTEVPALHTRASRWFEAHGWTDEAIEHALSAGDEARAAELVEGIAFKLGIHWNNSQLIRYVRKLPMSLLPEYPRLCIYYTWALTNTGQVSALDSFIGLLEESEQHAEQPHTVRACRLTMRAYERLRQLDFAASALLCQAALAELEPSERRPNGERFSDEERWLFVAATNLLAYGLLQSDLKSAENLYPTALGRSEQLGNLVGTINGYARLGGVQHRLGKLHIARQTLEQGLSTKKRWAEESREPRVVNVGELHLNYAQLLYEWDRLDEAEGHLQQARDLNQLAQFPPVQALEHKTAFQLHLARGELDAAQTEFLALDSLAAATHPRNPLFGQILEGTAMELRILFVSHWVKGIKEESRQGLLGDVVGWVERHGISPTDAFTYASERPYYILALLFLRQGKHDEALGLLGRLSTQAESEGRMDALIRYLTLQALAHPAEERSLEPLGRALTLAAPEGYRRSFLDHGPPLRSLLVKRAQCQTTPYLTSLLTALARQGQGSGGPDIPLTQRQQEIIRLLAAGCSDKDIARRLELSTSTVKWYLRNLYEALGVHTRVKAINRAKELGLV